MQRTHTLLAALAVTAAATTGVVTARRAAPAAAPTPGALLKELPAGDPKASSTDRELARWRAQLERKPGDDRAWSHLGDTLMQKFREALDHRYVDWAEKSYRTALALDPKRADVLVGLAWVSSERHRFDLTIDWAQKALAIDPQIPEAHGLMGDARVETGDWDGAFESYQKMLDIRPDLSSYSRGAHLLYLTGDTRKALFLMQKAIDAGGPRAENTAWCRAKLAEMLLGEGAVLPARKVLDDAHKRAPENFHVLLALGRVMAAQGDSAGATECLRKAAAVAPQQPQPLALLGDLHAQAGRRDEAEKCYAQVEAIDAVHPKATPRDELFLARFRAERGRDIEKAVKVAEANRDVTAPVDADTVAWCFFQSGRLDEAKTFSDRAMEKGKADPAIQFHAGMIAARRGERHVASELLYRCLSRDPHFSLLDPPVAAQTLKELGSRR